MPQPPGIVIQHFHSRELPETPHFMLCSTAEKP
jgi:hypothetical protein